MKFSSLHRISLAVTGFFCLFILPITERIAFAIPADKTTFLLALSLKILFLVCFYFLVYFVCTFFNQVRNGNQVYIKWLKYSAIYACAMAILFALIYPGHWVHDEFKIVESVKDYSLDYTWQHIFTNIFYTFSLYIIPTAPSIVVIQAGIISLIIGYVISRSEYTFKLKRFAWILFIPFFLFPVLLNNFYPLRGALYSYLALLLVAKLVFLYYNSSHHTKRYEFVWLCTLIMLVSFWRSEGIYFLILLPILAVWMSIYKRGSKITLHQLTVIALSLLILVAGAFISKSVSSTKYEITAMINPLSTMVQHPLKGDNVQKRLNTIDKTVDIHILKQHPSYIETPAFWNGAVRSDYAEHYNSFKKEYIYLVVHNPRLFLDNRVNTFMATNSFGAHPSASHGRLEANDYREDPLVRNFVETNPYSEPLAPSIKQKVVHTLLSFTDDFQFNAIGHILWNNIIPIVLLAVITIYKAFRREWFWCCILLLILLRVPLLFLTAPANYFFYYLPVYIAGYFFAFLHLSIWLSKRVSIK